MPDRHAMLGPSSAHRWLTCTPCAKLEEDFPNEDSVYAKEGTLAHALCEWKLRTMIGIECRPMPEPQDKDMDEYTTQYKDFVEEELNACKAVDPTAKLLVEQELDLSDYVPGSFGTSDAVIISDTTLTVIDFKYGKGIAVDAYQNPQLMLYALGSYLALESLYSFTEVRMIIFQPRISNVSDYSVSVEELLKWANEYVKPRAALAWEGKGEFVAGEHCRFCRAGAVCKARMQAIFPVLDHDKVLSPILKDDEIPELMAKFDATRTWMDAIEEYAKAKAIGGHSWPGYKLVESRTVRKISDPIEASKRLQQAGYSQDEYTNVKLKGIGDLEKLVGKKEYQTILGDLTVKPVGEPTLVKVTDKRPAITPAQMAFKDN